MARYFEELDIWQEARVFTNKIYEVIGNNAFQKDYGLTDQIRRASVSPIARLMRRGGA